MPKKKVTPLKVKKEKQKSDAKTNEPVVNESIELPEQTTRIISAVSYLWILFLIPLLLKRDDFVQFHAKQGLMLFITSFIIMFLSVIPILGWIIAFFGWIAIFIFSILGIFKSLQGERWEVPYLGRFSQKIQI